MANRFAETVDGGILNFGLVVTQKSAEVLDQVRVGDVLSKRFCEFSKVAGETKTHLPRLVSPSTEQSWHVVHEVVILAHGLGKRNERLEAENTDGVLLVSKERLEDLQKLVALVVLLQLGGEFTDLLCASSANHWSIVLAKFDELSSQALLLHIGSLVSMLEEHDR